MILDCFTKKLLDFGECGGELFNELIKATKFEHICKGRQGGVLVKPKDGAIPIVRTTTKYT